MEHHGLHIKEIFVKRALKFDIWHVPLLHILNMITPISPSCSDVCLLLLRGFVHEDLAHLM